MVLFVTVKVCETPFCRPTAPMAMKGNTRSSMKAKKNFKVSTVQTKFYTLRGSLGRASGNTRAGLTWSDEGGAARCGANRGFRHSGRAAPLSGDAPQDTNVANHQPARVEAPVVSSSPCSVEGRLSRAQRKISLSLAPRHGFDGAGYRYSCTLESGFQTASQSVPRKLPNGKGLGGRFGTPQRSAIGRREKRILSHAVAFLHPGRRFVPVTCTCVCATVVSRQRGAASAPSPAHGRGHLPAAGCSHLPGC
mgnify:CR=1 FL=1